MSCRRCFNADSGTTDLCLSCEALFEYEQGLEEDRGPWAEGYCWLAQFSWTPCEGRMDRAHLLPQQLLKREFPHGAWLAHDETWCDYVPLEAQAAEESGLAWPHRSLHTILHDPRGWVPACRKHHGALDTARTLRIPREGLPAALEAFAEAHGLTWWLVREYGPSNDEKEAA